jgi:hypothetical protein
MADLQATLSYQSKRLWDDFKDIALVIGEFLLPVVKLLVGALREITGAFKNLSPWMQKTLISVVGGIAVWVTLQKLLSTKMAQAILQTIFNFSNLILAKMGDASATALVAKANTTATKTQWDLTKATIKGIWANTKNMLSRLRLLITTRSWLTSEELATAAARKNAAAMYGNTVATAANTTSKSWGITVLLQKLAAWTLNTVAAGANSLATWFNTVASNANTASRIGGVVAAIAGAAATGLMTVAMWAAAAATWAATLPLIAIVAIIAALVAIGYAFYKLFFGSSFLHISEGVSGVMPSIEGLGAGFGGILETMTMGVQWWKDSIQSAWDTIKGFFSWLGSGIASGFMKTVGIISDLASGLVSILVFPFELLMSSIDAVSGMFNSMTQAITALAAPFMPFIGLLKSAIELAWKVKKALMGSSMFHIKEGAAEVVPALGKVESAFTGIHRAAAKVSDGTQLPDDIRVKIQEPLSAGAGAPGALAPAAGAPAAGQSTGAGGGLAAASAPAGGSIHVSIPVRVELDGMVLARAMKEHTIEIANERHFNEPTGPLRGIES